MNQEDWPTKDYQTALSHIVEHENEAASRIILPVDKGITAVLGLPLYGAGFYGIFMLSPIILFMLVTTTSCSLSSTPTLWKCKLRYFFQEGVSFCFGHWEKHYSS